MYIISSTIHASFIPSALLKFFTYKSTRLPNILSLTGLVATNSWLLAIAVSEIIVTTELQTKEKNRFLCRVILWQLKLLEKRNKNKWIHEGTAMRNWGQLWNFEILELFIYYAVLHQPFLQLQSEFNRIMWKVTPPLNLHLFDHSREVSTFSSNTFTTKDLLCSGYLKRSLIWVIYNTFCMIYTFVFVSTWLFPN